MREMSSRLKRLPREALGLRWSRQVGFGAAVVVGAVTGLGSLLIYAVSGYSRLMLLLWLAGLVGLSIFFWSRRPDLPRIARADLLIPPGLALLFSPIYLIALYRWPVQVSGDEIAITDVAKAYSDPQGVDPFGASFYFYRPTLLFLGWGKLGEWFGGFDLSHMRLLHAVFGLLAIAASYALLRQLLPRGWAVFAAVVFGSSHAFLMISRLAMRENTAVLAEVVALALLLWGLRNQHALATFGGGVLAGLGFYVYYPARATFPVWLAFLVVLGLLSRRSFPARRLFGAGAIACTGFVLMAGPILIAESNIPSTPGYSDAEPQQSTLLIYADGRKKQQEWVQEDTVADGLKKNIRWGLAAFNSDEVVDQGFIYVNPGHGFVDPLTGILLWLGVGILGFRLIRRRADEGVLLAVTGFLILWLSFAFLVNKAPNYTRLLIVLPFVAYLVTEAVRWLAVRWDSARHASAALVAVSIAALVGWNLAIAWDFIQTGRRDGDLIGSTGRYVHSHEDTPGQKFFIASTLDGSGGYYSYGDAGAYADRLKLFASNDSQVNELVDPSGLTQFNAPPPFVLFMRRHVWEPVAGELTDRYPNGRIRNVLPDGTRVVLEVPATSASKERR
jgi:hypothetical protein